MPSVRSTVSFQCLFDYLKFDWTAPDNSWAESFINFFLPEFMTFFIKIQEILTLQLVCMKKNSKNYHTADRSALLGFYFDTKQASVISDG